MNKLHYWATEQYDYSKAKLEEVNEKFEKLSTAKKRLDQVFKGVPLKGCLDSKGEDIQCIAKEMLQ